MKKKESWKIKLARKLYPKVFKDLESLRFKYLKLMASEKVVFISPVVNIEGLEKLEKSLWLAGEGQYRLEDGSRLEQLNLIEGNMLVNGSITVAELAIGKEHAVKAMRRHSRKKK